MSGVVRVRLIVMGAVAVAVHMAWLIAHGSVVLPLFVAATTALGLLVHLTGIPLAAWGLGAVLIGYLVGNRGFAQLMPLPGLPLLPAEIVLLIGAWRLLAQAAFVRTFPIRRDAMNGVILLWLLVGTARLLFDLQAYGFLAVRDYAMIYYAAFFFLAQHLAEKPRTNRFLGLALVIGCLLQPVAAVLSEVFQDFFLGTLVVRGVPLIFFKGDLALIFMAVSAIVLALATSGRWRTALWAVASIQLLYVLGGGNRAAMVGTTVALALLAVSRARRARRFVITQATVVVVAVLLVATLVFVTESRWAERRLHGVTERVRSLVDVSGQNTYVSEESHMKGDNNRFRWLWWRSVIHETVATSPAFGLGFGHDLSKGFLQVYNPLMLPEDFAARSPHSIIVTTFGRLGAAGLLTFLLIVVVLVLRTWRALRDPDTEPSALAQWASGWLILVSACFGVVLEGPMGAVVFWTMLGLANARSAARDETPAPVRPPNNVEPRSVPPWHAEPEVANR